VNYGWYLRSLHAIGASFFFVALYLHVGRGIYFGSYMACSTWFVGIVILVLVMAASFLGYVLPWGQISFWGATVITNLLSTFPYIGSSLVTWIWGGFAVDSPTLARFFALHFLLPFIISFFSGLHIFFLHASGTNNPLGVTSRSDSICFHWYYSIKDVFGFMVVASVAQFLIFFYPNLLLEADNFIPANPLITPTHILPEWYFLFAYAILRSVPSKSGGVISLVLSILVLVVLPLTHNQIIKGLRYYGPVKLLFWFFTSNFFLLTLAGGWPVVEPYLSVTRFFSFAYFSYYFLLPPCRKLWDYILF